MRLPTALRAFLLTVVVLTALSLATALEQQHHGRWQTGTHVLDPFPRAFDYFAYLQRFQYLHSSSFFTYSGYLNYRLYYPAPGLLVYYPFYLLDLHDPLAIHAQSLRGMTALGGYRTYVGSTLGLVLALCFGLRRALVREGLAAGAASSFALATLLLAYPIYFALQRGNIEALTWMLVAAAVWAFATGRNMGAAVLIGVAASIKIYPILFLGLYLRRGGLRVWGVAIAVAVGATVGALWLLDPHLAESARYVARGIHSWTIDYASVYMTQYDHSAFHLWKWFTHRHKPRYEVELHWYMGIVAALAVALYARVRTLPAINQVLFLTCAVVLLPPGSNDYTLCVLYVPVAWLSIAAVRTARIGIEAPALTLAMVLIGCVLPPDAFLNFAELTGNPGAFKAACLIVLWALSASVPLVLKGEGMTCRRRPERHGIVA